MLHQAYLTSWRSLGNRPEGALGRGLFLALAVLAILALGVQVIASSFDMGLTGFRNMGYLGVLLGMMVRLPDLDKQETPAAA